ncbi:hypothetical protein BR93DRAFT_963221 [Coniochaeta sp. PMI_546]|nr:hypothetical protein BR93DRAFT_963221 [Coniochaeta sp. PMI_546]
MCDMEEFLFTCGHNTFRLKSYCHFARNDPNHQCFGVKVLRATWRQTNQCELCRTGQPQPQQQQQQQQQQQASMSAHGGHQHGSGSGHSSHRA